MGRSFFCYNGAAPTIAPTNSRKTVLNGLLPLLFGASGILHGHLKRSMPKKILDSPRGLGLLEICGELVP